MLSLTVSASAPTAPDEDGFAWQVLSTLASEVTSDVGAGSFTLRLTMRPESAATGG